MYKVKNDVARQQLINSSPFPFIRVTMTSSFILDRVESIDAMIRNQIKSAVPRAKDILRLHPVYESPTKTAPARKQPKMTYPGFIFIGLSPIGLNQFL